MAIEQIPLGQAPGGEDGADARQAFLTVNQNFAELDERTTQNAQDISGKASTSDARFTDAREWTASTVSQAEAEAGTATTRRAWTAQRVFQAIAAWWNASAAKTKLDGIAAGAQVNVATNLGQGTRTSTALPLTSSTGTGTTLPAATTSLAGLQTAADKAKLDGIATGATANTTDAQLRDRSTHTGTQGVETIAGLGTAATKNVQTSTTDTTAGALMAVGAFGLGGPIRLFNALSITDLNEVDIPGDYWLDGGVNWVNCPVDAGQLIVHGAGKTYLTQEIYDYASSFHGERRKIDTVWTEWERVYTANTILGTVSQSGGVPTGAIIERGSNANGEYVRFADGTQICTHSPSFVGTGAGLRTTTWTYPAAFGAAPRLLVGKNIYPQATDSDVGLGTAAGLVSAQLRANVINGSAGTISLTSIAIGRWF